MQPQRLGAEAPAQVRQEQVAPLGELREAQHPVARGDDLVEQLLDPGQLAGAAGERRAVAQEVGRVVADLLEPQQPGQHDAAAVDALGLVGVAQQVVDDRLVQRGLLPGERAALGQLDLVGQVVDDRSCRSSAGAARTAP